MSDYLRFTDGRINEEKLHDDLPFATSKKEQIVVIQLIFQFVLYDIKGWTISDTFVYTDRVFAPTALLEDIEKSFQRIAIVNE